MEKGKVHHLYFLSMMDIGNYSRYSTNCAAGGLMQLVGYGAQDNPLGTIVPGLSGH
jgi:hypothetical protein